jgi:hypothetical protein
MVEKYLQHGGSAVGTACFVYIEIPYPGSGSKVSWHVLVAHLAFPQNKLNIKALETI